MFILSFLIISSVFCTCQSVLVINGFNYRIDYLIIDTSGLINTFDFYMNKKFLCFKNCLSNRYCRYVSINKENCSLFYGNASKILKQSNEVFLYNKKSDLDLESNCKLDSEFWSLTFKTCLPCPNGFKRHANLPYACYAITTLSLNFLTARSYCNERGAFLPRPKTANERNFLKVITGGSTIWLDSRITSLGEDYKWGDGTLIPITDIEQPKNIIGFVFSLLENALGLENGLILEFFETSSKYVTCQYE